MELENYEYKGYRVVIGYDEYSESPTEWGNYTVKPWREVDGIDEDERTLSEELQAKLKDGRAFWVDKYEHGGSSYTLATEGMNDRFDTSSQWGIIEFSDEYATNFDDYEGRKGMARNDLEEYTQWANGEVYSSYVYEIAPDGEDGEEVDGSGGIYGLEYAKEMAESTIDRLEPPRSSKYAVNAGRLHI